MRIPILALFIKYYYFTKENNMKEVPKISSKVDVEA